MEKMRKRVDVVPKNKLTLSTILDAPIISRIMVGIGEAVEITGVSPRQLRYWEEKGIIRSLGDTSSANRRYDYPTLEKIVLLKDFLDQGFTLEAATRRLEERIQQLNKTILKLTKLALPEEADSKQHDKAYFFIGVATHPATQDRFNIFYPANGDSNGLLAEKIE